MTETTRTPNGPSAFTYSCLSAVSAVCLPPSMNTADPKGSAQAEHPLCLARQAAKCRERAEARAADLATGILRRCLLGHERDSQGWSCVEAFVSELLEVRQDLHVVAAPLPGYSCGENVRMWPRCITALDCSCDEEPLPQAAVAYNRCWSSAGGGWATPRTHKPPAADSEAKYREELR